MKRKHYPIIAVAFFLVLLSAVSFRFYQVVAENQRQVPKPFVKPLPEIQVPKLETVRVMARLEKLMPGLAKPTPEKKWPVNLRPFGYQPVKKGRGISEKSVPPGLGDHLLSMVFVGGPKGFCIIDGRFYSEGSELPDGARIAMVKRDRVLLKNKHRQKWIVMKSLEESIKSRTDQAGETLS